MDLGDRSQREHAPDPVVPVTDRPKMVAAGVLLALPLIGLMWVPGYARTSPELFGFPFFFWYQFLWVFLCSAATWSAYLLTVSARRPAGHRAGDAGRAGGSRRDGGEHR